MNKDDEKLIRGQIEECENEISFHETSNARIKSFINTYVKLGNLMNTLDDEQIWLKEKYEEYVRNIKKESNENFDTIQLLKEEIYTLEKIISIEDK
jgi:hypothetical protein